MKSYSTALSDYRAAGKAHGQISYVSIRVREVASPSTFHWFHFSTDEDEDTVTVVNQIDDAGLGAAGATSARLFLGAGRIVGMGDLVRSEKEIIRSHSFILSGAAAEVLDMVHGYNCRGAHFEWHICEIDQDSGLPVDAPVCEFVGIVNTIDLSDTAIDVDDADPGETTIPVTVDSIAAALTSRNYEMRSKSASEGRGGDKFFQYAESAHRWRVQWGKGKRSEMDRRGNDSGGRDRDPLISGRPDHT